MSDELSLTALFVSSFLSATLLPGGSEAVLFGVLKFDPALLWSALALATLGNTLGGMSSYLLGRLVPERAESRAKIWLKRWGGAVLLLSWLPLIGDALCLAAGWLRLNPFAAALFMAIGKLGRYGLVAWAAL